MRKITKLSIAAGLLLSLLPSCDGISTRSDNAEVEFFIDYQGIWVSPRSMYQDSVRFANILMELLPTTSASPMEIVEGLNPCVNNLFAFSTDDPNAYGSSAKLSKLYRVNGNSIELLDSGFRDVGFLNCDRIPVVRPGEAPVILDKDMNVVFKAEEVDSIPVSSVASAYSENLLWFRLEDGSGGCFDKDGNVAFHLKYTNTLEPSISANKYFVNGFVFFYYDGSYVTLDTKGNIMHRFNCGTRQGKYIVTDNERMMEYYSAEGDKVSEEPISIKVYNSETVTDEDLESALEDLLPFDCRKAALEVAKRSSLYTSFSTLSESKKYFHREILTNVPYEKRQQWKEARKPKTLTMVLTSDALGEITLGSSKSLIPNAVDGLYSSKSYTVINHDENMDCPPEIHGYYTCSLNGKNTCGIYINDKNAVCGIYVTTPSIKSSEDVKTGMSTAAVKKIAGMNYEAMDMGYPYYYGKAGIQYIIYDDNPGIISAMAIGLYY